MAVSTSTTEGTLYTRDTLISLYTNKPLPAGTTATPDTRFAFWCATCCRPQYNIMAAIQHMKGTAHKNKASWVTKSQVEQTNGVSVKKEQVKPAAVTREVKDETTDSNLKCEVCQLGFTHLNHLKSHLKNHLHLKRTHKKDGDDAEVSKEKPSEVKKAKIRCEDCNIEFNSEIDALPHFKGKKHASKVARKIMEQQEKQRETSARGRGWGRSSDRGRGGFGRGYTGGNNYTSNPSFRSNQSFNSNQAFNSNQSLNSNRTFNSGSLSEYRTTPLTMSNYYSTGYNDNIISNSNSNSNYRL